ncbi:hypothetical protein [Variovorax sp. dw_954]|uniref:hypothetical protein n=1 Tax=Variovorax sp. dw_954 TaxID=2720078 RepID=UPI001BD6CD1E|nr:hypothetical protein [Variovorax sp. dw_954]
MIEDIPPDALRFIETLEAVVGAISVSVQFVAVSDGDSLQFAGESPDAGLAVDLKDAIALTP